jgi:hypothetical protein
MYLEQVTKFDSRLVAKDHWIIKRLKKIVPRGPREIYQPKKDNGSC